MNERQSLLDAVLAAPDDDLPRLIYADWLDERGETAMANFIRIQLAIAQGEEFCERFCTGDKPKSSDPTTCPQPRCRCKPCTLRRREYELWSKHRLSWNPAAMRPCMDAFNEREIRNFERMAVREWREPSPWTWLFTDRVVTFRRGFPAAFRMPLGAAVRWMPALMAMWPVESVRIVDREPTTTLQGHFTWVQTDSVPQVPTNSRGYHVPVDIANGTFDTPELAHAALSDAILAYSRSINENRGVR